MTILRKLLIRLARVHPCKLVAVMVITTFLLMLLAEHNNPGFIERLQQPVGYRCGFCRDTGYITILKPLSTSTGIQMIPFQELCPNPEHVWNKRK